MCIQIQKPNKTVTGGFVFTVAVIDDCTQKMEGHCWVFMNFILAHGVFTYVVIELSFAKQNLFVTYLIYLFFPKTCPRGNRPTSPLLLRNAIHQHFVFLIHHSLWNDSQWLLHERLQGRFGWQTGGQRSRLWQCFHPIVGYIDWNITA